MVVAAEIVRRDPGNHSRYGTEPISIGFWVGGSVTPNRFDDLRENPERPYEAGNQKNLIYKQLLTCPFCGKPLTKDEFYIDPDRKSVEIYCSDEHCMFYNTRIRENVFPFRSIWWMRRSTRSARPLFVDGRQVCKASVGCEHEHPFRPR